MFRTQRFFSPLRRILYPFKHLPLYVATRILPRWYSLDEQACAFAFNVGSCPSVWSLNRQQYTCNRYRWARFHHWPPIVFTKALFVSSIYHRPNTHSCSNIEAMFIPDTHKKSSAQWEGWRISRKPWYHSAILHLMLIDGVEFSPHQWVHTAK